MGILEEEARAYNYIGIFYLIQSDLDKTEEYFHKSLEIKEQLKDYGGLANTYNNLGIINRKRGKYFKSLNNTRKALEMRRKLGKSLKDSADIEENKKKIGHAYMNLGNVFYQFGEYDRAINKYESSMAVYDSIGYNYGISGCYNNIGSIFEEMQDYDKAIKYYQDALQEYLKIDEIRHAGTCYSNIGTVYLEKHQYKKAKEALNKALELRMKVNDKRGISGVYSNLGVLNLRSNKVEKALDYLYKAIKLDNEIDNKFGLVEDYCYLAKAYMEKGNFNDARNFAYKSLNLAENIDNKLKIKEAYEVLAELEEKQGNYSKALDFTKKYEYVEDELFSKEKTQTIETIETKYKIKEKQQELEKNKLQLAKKEAVIKKQRYQQYFTIGGLIIISLGLIFLYIHFRSKRKSHSLLLTKNDEIQTKNEELQGQNEEISMQRDELEKQRNIANQQRNEIAVKNDEITSSIRYAKSIQSAVLPPGHLLDKMLTNYFILFKPKDIVSGDFYFFDYKDGKMILAAVDCTGHGVPGAFMSLLGLSILNDITSEGILSSDVILNRLRTRVIQALHQESFNDENRDGMDISLVVWNLENNELQYSGAYNPLYVIRNGKLIEYKPDRMTLGIQSKLDQSFKAHNIQLQEGDVFYLFTDGFADQISGHFNKKMTKLKFKQFLTNIHQLSMQEQKQKLRDFYEEWRTGYEQVDDVLVMGFRI